MFYGYRAEIINLSQLDKSIFKKFTIVEVRKRFLGFIKIYTITIPEKDVRQAVTAIQTNMSHTLRKEWYVTIHNAEKAIIVFRHKIFELLTGGIKPIYQQLLDTSYAIDKTEWDKMITYASSLGIPDSQCDFLPPNFEEQTY